MPFDAIVTRNVVKELSQMLVGGRVDKIYQPFCDEIILNVRSKGENHKLLLSINNSLPRIHITRSIRENPVNAPLFSMILRKHLCGGRILRITCSDFERIVSIEIESQTELGDVLKKRLIIEIMGKHSNIILVNHEGKIIDSIKHVDSEMSTVREVMPARLYVAPPEQQKTTPLLLNYDALFDKSSEAVGKYMLDRIKGFSPYIIKNICSVCGVSYQDGMDTLSGDAIFRIKQVLGEVIDKIRQDKFSPYLEYVGNDVREFYCVDLGIDNIKRMSSIMECIDLFCDTRDKQNAIKTAKANVRKVVRTNISRCSKKIKLIEAKIREADRDYKGKFYGDLIMANLYRIEEGRDRVTLENFYSEDMNKITIPLDPKIKVKDNAQKYYKRYHKAKTTLKMQNEEINKARDELSYLEGIMGALDNSTDVEDVNDIKEELEDGGYITRTYSKYNKRACHRVSMPRKFVTKDGYMIAVGKNNRQNDELTMRWASPHDMWLHVRGGQGSHVVIRMDKREVPMDVIYKAAKLAAYYSKERESGIVEVDYTYVKNVRKPKDAKLGKVIYYNSKTVSVTPEIDVTLDEKK